MTTSTIKKTEVIHKCSGCRHKLVAIEHDGMLLVKSGKRSVIGNPLTVLCECGEWNYLTLTDSADVVD